MSTSTDGQICFGVAFEEDFEFPWGDDIEAWWKDVNNYVNPEFNPFTEEGDYKPGINNSDPRIQKHWTHQRQWEKDNPMPVDLINYCSGECPMFIIAVPQTVITANRGYPVTVDPELFLLNEAIYKQQLLDFFNKYDIKSAEPKWLLSSYWG